MSAALAWNASLADLRNLLTEGCLDERKAFIKSSLKEVKVTGDEVPLTCTIPCKQRERQSEAAKFLYWKWWAVLYDRQNQDVLLSVQYNTPVKVNPDWLRKLFKIYNFPG